MNVPLLDLKLQYATLRSEIEPKILSLMESQSLILGKEVEQLEQISAEYCKTKYALGVSSGTDALLMALMALNIGPGDHSTHIFIFCHCRRGLAIACRTSFCGYRSCDIHD